MAIDKNVPEIRFEEFKLKYEEDGGVTNLENLYTWEQRKFTDIVDRVNLTSNSNEIPKVEFEDIVAGEGRLNKDISEKFDSRKGTIFHPNNILYGKLRPYLKNWLQPAFKGIALGDFWVFEAKDTDAKFDYYLIQADKYQRIANDTSGTKMPRSDWRLVSDSFFSIPKKEEQQKIGTFLKTLDNTIALHQHKYNKIVNIKKAMLEKMFTKQGTKVPEIRFAEYRELYEASDGDTNIKNPYAWKQRVLKEIAKYRNGKAHEQVENKNGEYTIINSKFISTNGGIKRHTNSMVEQVFSGEITIVLSDLPNGKALAKVFRVQEDNKYTLNQRIAAITPNEYTDSSFLSYRMNRNSYFLKFDNGVSQTNLSKLQVEDFISMYPDYKEQQKIGAFFKQLDELITLYQLELIKLKNIKKSLLEKIFVQEEANQ